MRCGAHARTPHRCGAAVLCLVLLCSFATATWAAQSRKPEASTTGVPHGQFLLRADEAIYNTQTGVVTARGHVEISNDRYVLLADRVSYDQNSEIVTAEGHLSILDPDGNVVFGTKATLSKDMAEGVVEGFAALMGQYGRLVAVKGERRQGRYVVAHRAVFTPCKICADEPTPLWQVKAVRIVHDNVKKEIVYTDASLEFMGVPVLYTPFFSQADPTVKHKSGLLIPDFGSSSILGTFVHIPIYVAFSDSQDMTISPFITTSAGTVLAGEYRERWGKGGMWLQGSVGYNSEAPVGEGPWSSHLFGSGRTPITNIWRAGFDVQLTSNDTYLRRYDISDKDRLVSDIFLEGIFGRSRAAITGYFFQGLRPTDINGQIPIVLPLVEYTYIPERTILGGQLRFDTNALAVYRGEGEDDERVSVSASWRLPLITSNGQLITFEALARGDVYHTTDALLTDPTATEDNQTITRTLALASLEWRWPFVSTATTGSTSYIVEPIIQLIASPYGGNPRGLPNEDSTSFEFNVTNLFSVNKFPGIDRWEDGPRANAGIRGSAIFPSGHVEVLLGEEFRLKDNHAFAPGSGLGGTRSDLVGRIKFDFSSFLDITHQVRLDQHTGSIVSNEIDIRARFGRSMLDLTYLSLPEQDLGTGTPERRKEINVAASLGVYGNWFVFGSAIRDLEEDEMRDARLGLTYQDECFQFSVGFVRKFVALRDLKPSSSILFRVGLLTAPSDQPVGVP